MLAIAELPQQRAALERFIAKRFHDAHGAHIQHFCSQLLGLRDALGLWQAAAGYTAATSGPLFLEQYLDRPVEEVLALAAGSPVARAEIAEVGNLAAAPGLGRLLIPALGRHLYRLGYRWVAFTATRELRNAFRRLQLEPLQLVAALPERLADGGASWGRYYSHDPAVMGGRIVTCLQRR